MSMCVIYLNGISYLISKPQWLTLRKQLKRIRLPENKIKLVSEYLQAEGIMPKE